MTDILIFSPGDDHEKHVRHQLHVLLERQLIIMATLQDIQAAAQAQADATAQTATELTNVAGELGKLADLVTQIRNGTTGINPADLDAVVTQINDSTSKLTAAATALQSAADAAQTVLTPPATPPTP